MLSDGRRRTGLGSLVALTLVTALGGCGELGLNPPSPSLLEFKMGGEGCLNDLGRQFEEFGEGTVSQQEWQKSWDCASASFEQFRVYARGSDETGFTSDDLRTLVAGFLITDRPVPDELIHGALRLKSAVLGGSALVLTYGELEQVLGLMAWGKESTSRLIPLMKSRSERPDVKHLAELSAEIQRIAEELASKLGRGTGFLLKWSELRTLAELSRDLLKMDLPVDTIFAAAELGKSILLAGSTVGIETDRIPDVIRMAAPVLAAALELTSMEPSLLTGPNEAAEFYLAIAESIRPTIDKSLSLHGGRMSLEWIDRILELIPVSVTTTPHGHVVDRSVLRETLRTVNWRILRSQRRFEIDATGVERIFALFREWTRGQTLLETLFENVGNGDPEGMTRLTFREAADRMRGSLSTEDQGRLDRLTDMVSRYAPLYVGNETEIHFGPLEKYSRNTVSMFHLFRLVGDELLNAYSTVRGKKAATLHDLEILVGEWIKILAEIQKLDPTTSVLHERRFREGNLFTPLSNGDSYLDQDEITIYLAQMGSIGAMSARVESFVNEACGTDAFDVYGYRWMKPQCFRDMYFSGYEEYWKHMPGLTQYYREMKPAAQRRFRIALENGARRFGYSNELIGEWDLQGLAGIAQYVEGIFRRYDGDASGIINLEELMEAFPVFRGDLAAFGKIDPDQTTILEAAFTYTVRFGIPPTLDVMGGAHFVGWLASKPAWTIKADRAALYNVLAALNPKETPPSSGQPVGDVIDVVDSD